MSKIKSKYIIFDTSTNGTHSRLIPANFTPTYYTPAQVGTEGTDKISAHLKGIDAAINTKLSASGGKIGGISDYSEFEADGTLKFVGNATVWDDLRTPLYARLGATAPTYASGFAGNANLYSWYFSGNATNNMYFELQMPHSWAGTAIYPHVHWSPTTTGTGAVRWILEITWVNISGTFGASSSYNMDETISTDSQWKHLITGLASPITPTSSQNGLSSLMVGRVYRQGGTSPDTYAGNAALLAIDIHFEINTVGSRGVITK